MHNDHDHRFLGSIRPVMTHIVITLLAVGISFSLPLVAQDILYWWPTVQSDSRWLLIMEVAFSATLVLVFNAIKIAWSGRHSQRMNKIASLVYARERSGRSARRKERHLHRQFLGARDVAVYSITGHNTFGPENVDIQDMLRCSYEVRVMLLDPDSEGAKKRVDSLSDPEAALESYRQEMRASIAYLKKLSMSGKHITLKLYRDRPFWKLVVAGDYVSVQYCHDGREVKEQPEYVFALQRDTPPRGLFVPFFMYFLNQWNDPRHPEYSLETDELIYRDATGNEIRRTPLEYPKQPSEINHLAMLNG